IGRITKLFVATCDIAVSRVLFLHKHDCSALRQQLRLLLKRGTWEFLPFSTQRFNSSLRVFVINEEPCVCVCAYIYIHTHTYMNLKVFLGFLRLGFKFGLCPLIPTFR
ncbi:hypothetical protein L9F63_010927, partial [Diploptera punctata]